MITHSGMAPGHKVLELGCGTGAITQHILEQKGFQSYLGVEIDENLVKFLKEKFPDQNFLCASADDLKDHVPDESIDTVICSLPWTLFNKDLQEGIVQEIVRVLKPGGRFTTFLCVHALTYPGAPRAKKFFHEYFTGFQKRETIARNLPPANVYTGTK